MNAGWLLFQRKTNNFSWNQHSEKMKRSDFAFLLKTMTGLTQDIQRKILVPELLRTKTPHELMELDEDFGPWCNVCNADGSRKSDYQYLRSMLIRTVEKDDRASWDAEHVYCYPELMQEAKDFCAEYKLPLASPAWVHGHERVLAAAALGRDAYFQTETLTLKEYAKRFPLEKQLENKRLWEIEKKHIKKWFDLAKQGKIQLPEERPGDFLVNWKNDSERVAFQYQKNFVQHQPQQHQSTPLETPTEEQVQHSRVKSEDKKDQKDENDKNGQGESDENDKGDESVHESDTDESETNNEVDAKYGNWRSVKQNTDQWFKERFPKITGSSMLANAVSSCVNHKCHQCGGGLLVPNLKRCARCQSVYYCNRECQRKDWSTHKLTCTKK